MDTFKVDNVFIVFPDFLPKPYGGQTGSRLNVQRKKKPDPNNCNAYCKKEKKEIYDFRIKATHIPQL